MREILFKGKKIDTGEWVEGIPIKTHIGLFICFDENPHYCHLYGYMEIDKIAKVDETTLCQYTGLTDKNGNRIWENDIVICDGDEIDLLAKIEWDCDSAMFIMAYADNNYIETLGGVNMYGVEVIGSIFDNPELLKGVEE